MQITNEPMTGQKGNVKPFVAKVCKSVNNWVLKYPWIHPSFLFRLGHKDGPIVQFTYDIKFPQSHGVHLLKTTKLSDIVFVKRNTTPRGHETLQPQPEFTPYVTLRAKVRGKDYHTKFQ